MNKKLLSLVLSLVMVLGTFTSVFASAETPAKTDDKAETKKAEEVKKVVGKDNKIQYVIDQKFVEGYGNGDYGYDKNIKRSEITKLLVFANGDKELAEKLQGTMKLYKDVEPSFWANGVITVGTTVPAKANGLAMLNGFPNGDFKPEENVTYAQLSKMLVVLTKKDLTADMMKEANKHWAGQWMTWAAQLGLLNDVDVKDSSAAATRADAFTMVYNALYANKVIKTEKANSQLGILSALTNNKLTLNQNEKQQYTVTENTVYVQNTGKADRYEKASNLIKVKAMKNPELYLGSLVRVMVNDKNEVTHILELGNPEVGALGAEFAAKNARWSDVADYTASVMATGSATLNVTAKSTDIDSITLTPATGTAVEANITDDTQIFVADVANNQLVQLKDINAAVALLGYDSLAKIPSVYIGYNQTKRSNAIQATSSNDATVIVFNKVNKDNLDKKTYRVVSVASNGNNGNLVVENTKGEKFDINTLANAAAFPFGKVQLATGDVFTTSYDVNTGGKTVTKVIDADDTTAYPVVTIVDVKDDYILVEDVNSRQAIIDTDGAKVFVQPTDKAVLVKGAKVQFALKANTNTATVVSIVDTAVAGSLKNVVADKYSFAANASLVTVARVEADLDNENQMNVVFNKYDLLNDKVLSDTQINATVGKTLGTELQKYAGTKQLFSVEINKKNNLVNNIYTVTVNNGSVALVPFVVAGDNTTAANANATLEAAVAAINGKELVLEHGKTATEKADVQQALLAGLLKDPKYAKIAVKSVTQVEETTQYKVVLTLAGATDKATDTATMTITVAAQ